MWHHSSALRRVRRPAAFQCETPKAAVERSLACGTFCSGPNRSIELLAAVRFSEPMRHRWVLAAAIWGTLVGLVSYTASAVFSPRGIRIPTGLRKPRAHPFRLPRAIHAMYYDCLRERVAKQLGRATLLTPSVLPEVAFVHRTALAKHGCCATRLEQGATSSCL